MYKRQTYGSTKNTDGMSGATGVICRAFKALGGFKNQSEAELIAAIYAECSKLDTNGKCCLLYTSRCV